MSAKRCSACWVVVVVMSGCSDGSLGSPTGAGGGASTYGGSGASGGSGAGAGAAAGGVTATPSGGLAGAGGSSTGGSAGAAGGMAVVDCAGIASAGYELCASSATSCEAVFSDGAGCTAVCAAAGLTCAAAYENVDVACAADGTLPAVACDSGHQSDYCVCQGASMGAGGAGGAGGGGTGGISGAGDCNDVTDQPVLEVAADGSGQYETIGAALQTLSNSNTTPTQIRIKPGTYYEKLLVTQPFVTLCGEAGQAAATVVTYDDNAKTPTDGGELGTSGSFSMKITASDVSVENLTIENSTGAGVQAVALMVQSQRAQFRHCRLLGYQDTLYVHSGTQYFRSCHIEGTVDFIFGGAAAVFDDCTIHTVAGGSAITAPSTEQDQTYGLVFLGGEVTAESSVANGSQALGRNWRPYGSSTYIGTELGDHVSGVGWVPMGDNTLETARFAEYQTTGPGANPGARAPQSSQLSAEQAGAYTVDTIFGSWSPSYGE